MTHGHIMVFEGETPLKSVPKKLVVFGTTGTQDCFASKRLLGANVSCDLQRVQVVFVPTHLLVFPGKDVQRLSRIPRASKLTGVFPCLYSTLFGWDLPQEPGLLYFACRLIGWLVGWLGRVLVACPFQVPSFYAAFLPLPPSLPRLTPSLTPSLCFFLFFFCGDMRVAAASLPHVFALKASSLGNICFCLTLGSLMAL